MEHTPWKRLELSWNRSCNPHTCAIYCAPVCDVLPTAEMLGWKRLEGGLEAVGSRLSD